MKVIDDYAADNALVIGTALHTGIEKGVDAAITEYYNTFPIISDEHITEAMKLEMQIKKAREIVPKGQHEVLISTKKFKGFIDLLVCRGYMSKNSPWNTYGEEVTVYEIWDFKYSNNIDHYKKSRQLHLYKYYFEQMNPGKKIVALKFLFVPKNSSKQKQGESLYHFRNRILTELSNEQIKVIEIPFDYKKVIEHLEIVQDIQEEQQYPKEESWLCRYCEYEGFCQKGHDYMILPSAERRNINKTSKRKIWIYGAAFSGKTTMLDEAPNPLNLNTDGNIQFVTMPYMAIKDEVKTEGRVTKRKYAWEVFKDVITELEKGGNDFQTIIIDLLEDTREMCRIYMYDQLGIQHESDSGYGKAWDIIKTEYLSTIRRFFNLDYENIIVVSHEDVSKDITKKNGQNITRIAPNIQDAIANKIAGMVDIVARVVVEDDGTRTLNFKQNEVIFGGGRLKGVQQTSIPLSWSALMQVYEDANRNTHSATEKPADEPKRRRRETVRGEEEAPQESAQNVSEGTEDEVLPDMPEENYTEDLEPLEEAPKRTRRRKKQETDGNSGNWTPGGGEVDDSVPFEGEAAAPDDNTEEAAEKEAPPKRTRRTRKNND